MKINFSAFLKIFIGVILALISICVYRIYIFNIGYSKIEANEIDLARFKSVITKLDILATSAFVSALLFTLFIFSLSRINSPKKRSFLQTIGILICLVILPAP